MPPRWASYSSLSRSAIFGSTRRPLDEARVYYYQDNTGLEADAIVEHRDGRWSAFEMKLGPNLIDEAANHLVSLANRVDLAVHGRPTVLGVITGWGAAYRRDDGVWVIPIGTLGA